ncbi:hypothetical protein [Marinilabilia salmonicolor]|uniref:hypothetical protein n=1 Tax=Marinilabilia salmonicolor TaxID=989 RepID=UPI00131F17F3|nr:hypothetical protein [Marinilabilia salmonicolor]
MQQKRKEKKRKLQSPEKLQNWKPPQHHSCLKQWHYDFEVKSKESRFAQLQKKQKTHQYHSHQKEMAKEKPKRNLCPEPKMTQKTTVRKFLIYFLFLFPQQLFSQFLTQKI